MRPIFNDGHVTLPPATTVKQAIAGVSRMLGSYQSGDLVGNVQRMPATMFLKQRMSKVLHS
jgi:hypothetical protein